MDGHTKSTSLREVMGTYPTGVTIVASCDADGEPYGLTVNSFTSVSLDPPLVLVCLGQASASHARLSAGSSFSINILSTDQSDLASRFAREPSKGRFDSVPWPPGSLGDPVIAECVASLDCTLQEVMAGGDHSIILARVEAIAMSDRPALVFYRGRLGSPS